MSPFDVEKFRKCFPILTQQVHGQNLIYFDNAATTQKMLSAISAISTYYSTKNANVHRASHALSAKATELFEQTREQVRCFLGARLLKEIVWTKGATDAINLVAESWGRKYLKAGDEILLSQAEHHANIVPWQLIAESVGAVIKVIPLSKNGDIDVTSLNALLSEKTRMVSVQHISNVLGKINDIKKIIALVKSQAKNAYVLIDGAQAAAHEIIDVAALDCDFYVFSAHKVYGPTGLGVLYGKADILKSMPPYQAGGEMIKHVSFKQTTFNDLPFKFEAGTPNISAVVGFGETLNALAQYNMLAIKAYEADLARYGYQQLKAIKGLKFISAGMPDIPIFSFTIEDIHSHDIATELNNHGIAVRSGHHCAMPLMQALNINGCVRVSLSAYNTKSEINRLVEVLNSIIAHADSHHERLVALPINRREVTTPQQLIELFNKARGWDEKHREIMLLGKKLDRLPKFLRKDDLFIDGCESKAWLKVEITPDSRFIFTADSDAKVIRGLIYIVLSAYQNKTEKEIHRFNIAHYFEQLGLLHHLSPSRGNGLMAIVQKIREITKDNR